MSLVPVELGQVEELLVAKFTGELGYVWLDLDLDARPVAVKVHRHVDGVEPGVDGPLEGVSRSLVANSSNKNSAE